MFEDSRKTFRKAYNNIITTFVETGYVWAYNKDLGLYKCLRADQKVNALYIF